MIARANYDPSRDSYHRYHGNCDLCGRDVWSNRRYPRMFCKGCKAEAAYARERESRAKRAAQAEAETAVGKAAVRGPGGEDDFQPVVTDEFVPTEARAGSEAKMAVLIERVRRGLPLWHSADGLELD